MSFFAGEPSILKSASPEAAYTIESDCTPRTVGMDLQTSFEGVTTVAILDVVCGLKELLGVVMA